MTPPRKKEVELRAQRIVENAFLADPTRHLTATEIAEGRDVPRWRIVVVLDELIKTEMIEFVDRGDDERICTAKPGWVQRLRSTRQPTSV